MTAPRKGTSWDIDKVSPLINEHGYAFARVANPRGMVKRLKPLGPLRGHCFERCLQIANSIPEKFWYCEGLADGRPHAWLSPKSLDAMIENEDEGWRMAWCLDPVWLWKSPKWRNWAPLDDVEYYGLRLEGPKVIEWLLNRSKTHGPVSCSLFKSVGLWNIDELI